MKNLEKALGLENPRLSEISHAGRLEDCCVLTCDNPPYESMESIDEDIKEGIRESRGSYVKINDRKKAID